MTARKAHARDAAAKLVSGQDVEAFQRDGAVCLRGLVKHWTEPLKAGIETNMAEPGPYAAENLEEGEKGRFFDDCCNWTRIPEFSDFVHLSPAAEAAAPVGGGQVLRRYRRLYSGSRSGCGTGQYNVLEGPM